MKQIEEYAMKHCLLVAILAVGVAACGERSIPKPGTDADVNVDAEPDARADAGAPPPDAQVTVDVSERDTQPPSPDVGLAADSGAAPRPDASPDTTPSPPADARARADLAADAGRDRSSDGPSAPGATCGPGASREMLCATYCDGVAKFCTGSNAIYRSAEDCFATCVGPAWPCGNPGETTGNSLFCRLTHLALAGVGSASQECPNAGPGSPTCQ